MPHLLETAAYNPPKSRQAQQRRTALSQSVPSANRSPSGEYQPRISVLSCSFTRKLGPPAPSRQLQVALTPLGW